MTAQEPLSGVREDALFGNAIYPLLCEARANDRRQARWGVRYPLFRDVSVITSAGQCFSAFCRDISASGIGLLHNMELPVGEVEIGISSEGGSLVKVSALITRCHMCRAGWYVSGGQFQSRTPRDAQTLRKLLRPLLREALESDDREDPAKIRYPCLRPAMIVREGVHRHSAMVRDISVNGIGLLHDVDLPDGQYEVNIATDRGYTIRVLTQIANSRPCGEGWYISNGRFASIPAIVTPEESAVLLR